MTEEQIKQNAEKFLIPLSQTWNPIADKTIKERADQYVMSHLGCGRKHRDAYIAGAQYVLNILTQHNAI